MTPEARAEALKGIRKLELQLSNIGEILSSGPGKWVFSFDEKAGKLSASPLWASTVAMPILKKIAHKRIYISATLPRGDRQAKWLGIDPDSNQTAFLSLDSPFPVEHRKIISIPQVNWKRDHNGQVEGAMDRAAEAIRPILKKHEDQRGLIHVSSYHQMIGIAKRLNSRRLIIHRDVKEKEEALERHKNMPAGVLVSPSSKEGLDLKGELGEFQIIAKLPFASLGDKKVKLRMVDDPGWYPLHSVQQLMQASGRIVRSIEDVGPTYILDIAWIWFLRQNRGLFPRYFLDACCSLERADV